MTDKKTREQLIDNVKNHEDWRVRQESVHNLGQHQTIETMEAIGTALYDDSPHVVQTATQTLSKYGSDALPLLLEALNQRETSASPRFLLFALSKIGDPSVIPVVLEILESDETNLHYAALDVVRTIPDERFIDPVASLLDKTPEYSKHVVAQALGAIASAKTVPALQPLLYSSEQVTRRFSARALGRIGDETAIQALLDASKSDVDEVRYNVAEGLGMLNDERAFERLIELTGDSYPIARAMSADALAKFDGERAKPHLMKMLDDPDSNVQNSLNTALGNLSDLDIIPILMKRYREDEYHNAGGGLYLFAINYWDYESQGEDAVRDALEALKTDNQNLRITATWLLYTYIIEIDNTLNNWIKAGNEREDLEETPLQSHVIDVLVELLVDDNDDVRLSSFEPILRVGDKRATDNLIKCLDHNDPLIVRKAAECLGTVKDERAVKPLLQTAQSENEIIRNRIISSLGRIGGGDAFNGLVELLTHPHYWTRSNAAFALGNIGDKRATPILMDRLDKEHDVSVKETIVMSLGYLQDKRATETIIDILTNPPSTEPPEIGRLRYRAIQALIHIKDEASLPKLYHEVNTAGARNIRMDATTAIGQIGTPRERANRLFELLEHDHETVRTTAAKALGYLGAKTDDLELRDFIVDNLILRLQDTGGGYHASPTVAHMAAKSLYYVGTPKANEALRNWELKQDGDDK